MLSRTAENLFWIARYVERAEGAARLYSVGARGALIPAAAGGHRNEWEAVLKASGLPAEGGVSRHAVRRLLVTDPDSPSSVVACLLRARENGRIVRTALTSLTWEALGEAKAAAEEIACAPPGAIGAQETFDRVMRLCSLVRGAAAGTQLRDDGWDFLRLGHLIERLDGTARVMDVKYFVLLPSASMVGSGVDNYGWTTILRALSSQGAYTWAHGGPPSAERIVRFLVFDPDCPRSLRFGAEEMLGHLERLARRYGGGGAALARARSLYAELAEMTVAEVFEEGLHEFLIRMQGEGAALSAAIADDYFGGGA